MAVSDELRDAYSATGERWQHGPARVYDRLSDVLLEGCAAQVAGGRVADIGAGSGAGGRAARRAGAAAVVAFDVAIGMLRADPDATPALVADARAVPARSGAFDVALAAFSLNHVSDPATGLAEMARVVRPGGAVVVGAYADDDHHPVKDAVEEALRRRGWELPGWTAQMKDAAVPLLATVAGARSAARCAGLDHATVEVRRVPFPQLTVHDLVWWRLGMAQHAPFLAALGPQAVAAIRAEALDLLGSDPPPLVRSVVVVTSVDG